MKVRFWGVRGSVPWATPASIGHGCNTPCVQVSTDDGTEVLVLDAGSGIVGLGETMSGEQRKVPILLTHYHWDHLQGLPFFAPFYKSGWIPTIYAPALGHADLAWVDTVFQSPFFPLPHEQLPARPAVKPVGPGSFTIDGFDIRAQPLNHPGGALAYRIRGTDGDLVYATDQEMGNRTFDEALAVFVAGASALIIDSHFTPDESRSHAGWGHSNWADCAEFAAANDVERLWLFHHKPGRTDVELTKIEAAARRIFAAVDVAAEGDTFDV